MSSLRLFSKSFSIDGMLLHPTAPVPWNGSWPIPLYSALRILALFAYGVTDPVRGGGSALALDNGTKLHHSRTKTCLVGYFLRQGELPEEQTRLRGTSGMSSNCGSKAATIRSASISVLTRASSFSFERSSS